MGLILPDAIKNTDALMASLTENQVAVAEPILRSMIINAYRQEYYSGPSAPEEFGNRYALDCLEGKNDTILKIVWDEPTEKAFEMWANVMGSEIEFLPPPLEKELRNMHQAFERAAEAHSLEELKAKEEQELALLNALATETAAVNVKDAMQTRITRAWHRPVAFKAGLEVYLKMSLAPNGELVDVRVVKTSGDALFDFSAIKAVKNAAPFYEIKQFDAETFEEKFSSLTVKFSPGD